LSDRCRGAGAQSCTLNAPLGPTLCLRLTGEREARERSEGVYACLNMYMYIYYMYTKKRTTREKRVECGRKVNGTREEIERKERGKREERERKEKGKRKECGAGCSCSVLQCVAVCCSVLR